MSQNCYSRHRPEVVNVGRMAPEPPSRETGPQKETSKAKLWKQIGRFEGLANCIKTEAEKEKLIDLCQDF